MTLKDLPNPFWAATFILIASGLAVAAMLTKDKSDTAAIITMASSIITGAFGYIQGHKDGAATVSVPSQPSPTSATTVTVGDPSQPAGLAQPTKE